jgi:hypothetical protein
MSVGLLLKKACCCGGYKLTPCTIYPPCSAGACSWVLPGQVSVHLQNIAYVTGCQHPGDSSSAYWKWISEPSSPDGSYALVRVPGSCEYGATVQLENSGRYGAYGMPNCTYSVGEHYPDTVRLRAIFDMRGVSPSFYLSVDIAVGGGWGYLFLFNGTLSEGVFCSTGIETVSNQRVVDGLSFATGGTATVSVDTSITNQCPGGSPVIVTNAGFAPYVGRVITLDEGGQAVCYQVSRATPAEFAEAVTLDAALMATLTDCGTECGACCDDDCP